jgi:small GTP-binding protein
MTNESVPIPLFKVMLIGDGNVGKTSLARQYCEHKFEDSRILTIGVDFQIKQVELPDGWVKLSIWDVAGQPRFQVVRESFYRGSAAAALVFDLSAPETFDHLEGWLQEIRQVVPQIRIMLVGNKRDIEHQSRVNLAAFLQKEALVPYVETSAKTGEGVDEMFNLLAKLASGRNLLPVEKTGQV